MLDSADNAVTMERAHGFKRLQNHQIEGSIGHFGIWNVKSFVSNVVRKPGTAAAAGQKNTFLALENALRCVHETAHSGPFHLGLPASLSEQLGSDVWRSKPAVPTRPREETQLR